MTAAIQIDVGVGELIDKITILEIKQGQITLPEKLKNIRHELNLLNQVKASLQLSEESARLEKELKTINKKLWDIEDEIRLCESNKRFDEQFIQLARSVYITNDKRCDVKRQINVHHGSQIIEEKSYEEYEAGA